MPNLEPKIMTGCRSCNGAGIEPDECPECNGKGIGAHHGSCPKCRGSGMALKTCDTCHGSGFVEYVNLTLPAGGKSEG